MRVYEHLFVWRIPKFIKKLGLRPQVLTLNTCNNIVIPLIYCIFPCKLQWVFMQGISPKPPYVLPKSPGIWQGARVAILFASTPIRSFLWYYIQSGCTVMCLSLVGWQSRYEASTRLKLLPTPTSASKITYGSKTFSCATCSETTTGNHDCSG